MPIVLNYKQHFFPGGSENFSRVDCPVVTALVLCKGQRRLFLCIFTGVVNVLTLK